MHVLSLVAEGLKRETREWWVGFHWHSITGLCWAAESELREMLRPEESYSRLWANLIAHLESIHNQVPSPIYWSFGGAAVEEQGQEPQPSGWINPPGAISQPRLPSLLWELRPYAQSLLQFLPLPLWSDLKALNRAGGKGMPTESKPCLVF